MTFPILVTQSNGTFTASVLGAPQVAAEGPTREQAVATVTEQLRARVTAGEVVLVNVPAPAPPTFGPVSAEDAAAWRELCSEIYRERDAQKAAEWPE
jgi:predicted RNase H-like HicB family nuclease